MSRKIKRIIELLRQAQGWAGSNGIDNLFQPGLIKEMIIAELLGHIVIAAKHGADTHHLHDPTIKYEYLSYKEGGTGQLDRLFKSPPEKRSDSLTRMTRKRAIYRAVFYRSDQIKVKVPYERSPQVVVAEEIRKLDRSRNVISHVSFSVSWSAREGRVVAGDKRKRLRRLGVARRFARLALDLTANERSFVSLREP